MTELTRIVPKSASTPDPGLPPLADILPAPAPKAATLELERIGDDPDRAAGELQTL